MNIDHLISDLSARAKPVKYIRFGRVCAEGIAVTGVSFAIVLISYGLRPDIAARLSEPVYITELLMNLAMIFIAGYLATAMAYPDRARTGFSVLLAVPMTLFAGIFIFAATQSPNLRDAVMHTHAYGFVCLKCILIFACVPAAWMIFRLRSLLVIRPFYALCLSLMMALAAGGLGIRLVEPEPLTVGLLLWHYLPIAALSLLGLVFGRKIFR